MMIYKPYPALAFILFFLTACSTSPHKPEQLNTKSSANPGPLSEAELLDVSISVFAPGIDDKQSSADPAGARIRAAETIYIPYRLGQALAATEKWGTVRVLPASRDFGDVVITGSIDYSDSEKLELSISVKDATGKNWFTKRYASTANTSLYQTATTPHTEPFEKFYELIVQDLLDYQTTLDANSISTIRTVALLERAHRFVPWVSEKYLAYGLNDQIRIRRLPAKDDPDIARLGRVQSRNEMFLDTLQLYYTSFITRMEASYFSWRSEAHKEKSTLLQLQAQSRGKLTTGILTVFSSLIPFSKRNFLSFNRRRVDNNQKSSAVGVAAGTQQLEESLDISEQSQIHQAALQELGVSLASDIEPIQLTMEKDIISLSGTAEEQFTQWQQLLQEIYSIEFGSP